MVTKVHLYCPVCKQVTIHDHERKIDTMYDQSGKVVDRIETTINVCSKCGNADIDVDGVWDEDGVDICP